jgi:glucokinase
MNSILFDIGGTKMRLAYSENGDFFEEPKVIETPFNYEEGRNIFLETAKDLAKERPIKMICGGIAGPFDEKKRSLVGSPNLQDWIGKPFLSEVSDYFGAPMMIENDAALVGLGEACYGAGKDDSIVAYITVSTGVGGVRIVNKKIDEKAIGFEPGHQIIDADQTLVRGVNGLHLGYILSGKGVEDRTGRKPKDIKETEFWEQMARYLAFALNNVAVFWSPDSIVLGGSMITGDPAISIEKTAEQLKGILKIFPEIPKIKKAELGDFGGLYGALIFRQQKKI